MFNQFCDFEIRRRLGSIPSKVVVPSNLFEGDCALIRNEEIYRYDSYTVRVAGIEEDRLTYISSFEGSNYEELTQILINISNTGARIVSISFFEECFYIIGFLKI